MTENFCFESEEHHQLTSGVEVCTGRVENTAEAKVKAKQGVEKVAGLLPVKQKLSMEATSTTKVKLACEPQAIQTGPAHQLAELTFN